MSDKKEKKPKKKKQKPELDMETTFADMNVEGIRGYDPQRNKKKQNQVQLSKKEYWAVVRGAYRAMLPMILCMLLGFGLVILLAYLWLL
ncbi:MAG: hypothetical protein IJX30_06785 [Clostridia bacterium]|nr:hypothetical protein [Clostridia bacterium]